jgi:hypothetical protein
VKPPFLVLEKNIRDGGGSLILKFFIIPEPKVMTKSKDCPTTVDAKLDYLDYPGLDI